MNKCFPIIVFTSLLILTFTLSISTFAQASDPVVQMSIRQTAHDVGIKGRELAELLGLEAGVDKDIALDDLGISQEQLDEALKGASVPTPDKGGEPAEIHIGMTLQEAAHAMGITGSELAHILSLPADADKKTPLEDLGVSETALAEALKHAVHGEDGELKQFKYPIWVLICGLAMFLLMKGLASKTLYHWTLILSLTVAGFILGKAPNPMESVVKIFKTAVGIYPDHLAKIAGFVFFCVLAIIGNKVICGWGCPFGALQELLFEIPMGSTVKKLRKKKLPFQWTNMIRAATFALFVLFIFGLVGSRKGFVLYHYINPFNLFDFDLAMVTIMISVSVFVLASPVFCRGYCQFICPFGIISWFLEKISLARITINRSSCTRCMACVQACPLEAMKGRMDDRSWPADCFSCARCLRECSYDALEYKGRWEKSRDW